ncbi:MAG: hypothetical protein HeimC3_43290 [Candidatus Heimdallarchaeota archaeon LC_3]|nr:MAG: hypothetical protein HeimC3_43290 [Candidatus Heimdallarchaeota archaeon LC_3]
MSEHWESVPLNLIVLQIINKRDGLIMESDLLSLIDQELGFRPGSREFNRVLMNLEIQGKVTVVKIKKNQRQIKLVREKQNYLAIGED